jgi:CheY-like chemotaxis protein
MPMEAVLPQLSVFLVEDEVLIRMMISEMINELGHRVVAEAGSVAEAAPIAASAEFDLAILDINLKGDSVLPVVRMIEARRLPFLFASGYGATGLPTSRASPAQLQDRADDSRASRFLG